MCKMFSVALLSTMFFCCVHLGAESHVGEDKNKANVPYDLVQIMEKLKNRLMEPAPVRIIDKHPPLCPEEREYFGKRLGFVYESLKKSLGKDFPKKKTPKIALVFSGGGIRAAIYASVVLQSLEEMGILPWVSYIVTLSGSAWPVCARYFDDRHSWKDFTNEFLEKVRTMPLTYDDTRTIARVCVNICNTLNIVLKQWSLKQFSPVDLWGAYLGAKFFRKPGKDYDYFDTTLLNQKDLMSPDKDPSVIYSAVVPQHAHQGFQIFRTGREIRESFGPQNYWWADITPYYVSIPGLCFVSMENFGSIFKRGQVIKKNNPLPAALLAMGIGGSVFTVSLREALRHSVGMQSPLVTVLKYVIELLGIDANMRFHPRLIPNPTYKIPSSAIEKNIGIIEEACTELLTYKSLLTATDSDDLKEVDKLFAKLKSKILRLKLQKSTTHGLRYSKEIAMVDAGVVGNIPLPATFNEDRGITHILTFDASAPGPEGPLSSIINSFFYIRDFLPLSASDRRNMRNHEFSRISMEGKLIYYASIANMEDYDALEMMKYFGKGINTYNVFNYSKELVDDFAEAIRKSMQSFGKIFKKEISTWVVEKNSNQVFPNKYWKKTGE